MENNDMPYYKQINNVRYDRKLLSKALKLMSEDRNLQITEEGIKQLWEEAQDGGRVTDCERKTLEYIVINYETTAGAKQFLNYKLFLLFGTFFSNNVNN